MAKKFKINIELPIRTEYEGMINIIALMNGWQPQITDENGEPVANPVTALDFISNHIQPQQKMMLKLMIKNALVDYYGRSQETMIDQAITDFDNAFSCNVTFENIVPE